MMAKLVEYYQVYGIAESDYFTLESRIRETAEPSVSISEKLCRIADKGIVDCSAKIVCP